VDPAVEVLVVVIMELFNQLLVQQIPEVVEVEAPEQVQYKTVQPVVVVL
jgi:hypothetical protein